MQRAIAAAIQIGAPTFNAGNKAGCYYVYRRTAEEMVPRLGPQQGATRQRLEQALARGRALEQERNDVDGAAWAMRRAFDELLRAGEFAALAGGMPTAREIRDEPGFPGRRAAGASSSCCVIA